MGRRQAGAPQGDDGPGGVPYGRDRRLQAQARLVLRDEVVDAGDATRDHGVGIGAAEALQREDCVDPGEHDPAPTAVAVLMLADPALDPSQRQTPARLERQPFVEPE